MPPGWEKRKIEAFRWIVGGRIRLEGTIPYAGGDAVLKVISLWIALD